MRHMANKNLWLKPFDPSLKYMVTKPLKVGGVKLVYGDPLPENAFTTRQLRQFYDARKIGPIPEQETVATAHAKQPVIEPVKATVDTYDIERRGPAWAFILKGGERTTEKPIRYAEAVEELARLNAAF